MVGDYANKTRKYAKEQMLAQGMKHAWYGVRYDKTEELAADETEIKYYSDDETFYAAIEATRIEYESFGIHPIFLCVHSN